MQVAPVVRPAVVPEECGERLRELEAENRRLRAKVKELMDANARLLREVRRLEEQLRRAEDERDRAQTKVSFYEDLEEEWW